MNLQSAVVFDETELSESAHKEIHSGAGRTDHCRQSLLTYVRDHLFGPAFFPEAGQYQKRPRQPFFA